MHQDRLPKNNDAQGTTKYRFAGSCARAAPRVICRQAYVDTKQEDRSVGGGRHHHIHTPSLASCHTPQGPSAALQTHSVTGYSCAANTRTLKPPHDPPTVQQHSTIPQMPRRIAPQSHGRPGQALDPAGARLTHAAPQAHLQEPLALCQDGSVAWPVERRPQMADAGHQLTDSADGCGHVAHCQGAALVESLAEDGAEGWGVPGRLVPHSRGWVDSTTPCSGNSKCRPGLACTASVAQTAGTLAHRCLTPHNSFNSLQQSVAAVFPSSPPCVVGSRPEVWLRPA